jgi:hypothetical protein
MFKKVLVKHTDIVTGYIFGQGVANRRTFLGENEVVIVIKFLILLNGNLMPGISEIEGQIIKQL